MRAKEDIQEVLDHLLCYVDFREGDSIFLKYENCRRELESTRRDIALLKWILKE